ncbi:thioredoxin [Oscillospiraceae bacterium OttesenSCG-928-F05]|nr:thioredoxin [Oscillospiraceae bacterium OttesenSCG-928-F05]
MLTLTKDNFTKEVVEASGPVLVDFWAAWCGPCKAMAPVFEELAKKLEGKATLAKLNIDDESELAVQYRVMSIPTLVLFKDGQEVERIVGLQPEAAILKALSPHIG